MEDKIIRNETRVLEGLSKWILNLLVVMGGVVEERGVRQVLKSSINKDECQEWCR